MLLILSVFRVTKSLEVKEELSKIILRQFGHLECLYIHDGTFFYPQPETAPQIVIRPINKTTPNFQSLLFSSATSAMNCFVVAADIDRAEDFVWFQNILSSIQSEQRLSLFRMKSNGSLTDRLPMCDYLGFETIFAIQGSARLGMIYSIPVFTRPTQLKMLSTLVSSENVCASKREIIRASVIGIYPYIQYGNGTVNGTDVDVLNLWKKYSGNKVILGFGRSFDGVADMVSS